MKHIICICFLISGVLSAKSLDEYSKINGDDYKAIVTTEFLNNHSILPKERNLVEHIKTFTRIAHDYIETHFKTKISSKSIMMTHLKLCSLSEGDTTHYYVMFWVAVKHPEWKCNHYRIPITLDHTVIPLKMSR